MCNLLLRLWTDDRGQDIAEYAVMLALILVFCRQFTSVARNPIGANWLTDQL